MDAGLVTGEGGALGTHMGDPGGLGDPPRGPSPDTCSRPALLCTVLLSIPPLPRPPLPTECSPSQDEDITEPRSILAVSVLALPPSIGNLRTVGVERT